MATPTEELQVENQRRLANLARQGTAVQGLEIAYVTRLLEHLVGDELPEVVHKHEVHVSNQLDNIENQVARAKLLTGVHTNNGGAAQ